MSFLFLRLIRAVYLDDFLKKWSPSSQNDLTRFLSEAETKPLPSKTRLSDMSLGLDKSFNLSEIQFPRLLSGDSNTHLQGCGAT